MTKQEALEIFDGSARKLAVALGVSVQAVHQWSDKIPELRVFQIKDLRDKREAVKKRVRKS